MYKFANEEETEVNNLITKTYCINSSTYHWEQYEEWLAEGNSTEPYKTQAELDYDTEQEQLIANLLERVFELEEAKKAEGLNDLTVTEARGWISNKMDKPGTIQEKLEDIKSILLKMVPYILEYKI